MFFAIKKFISQFLMPMPLVCECFLLSWVLCHFSRYKKTSVVLKYISFILFLLFGYGVGRTYFYNLERLYPPFDPTPEQCQQLRGIPIIVLGQGMPEKSDLMVCYQNNAVFERRIFEGIRVAKLIPESHLLVSMAGDASNTVKQAALDYYLQQMNLPTNRVTMFITALDTSDEAKLAKQIFAAESHSQLTTNHSPFTATNSLILATSAAHLPRAMKIFQKQGFKPIASPCDYTQVSESKSKKEWYLLPFPSGGNFEFSQNVFHEWIGGIYESLTK